MSRNILPASLAADHLKLTSTGVPSPTAARWQPAKVKKLAGSACEYCRKRRRKCNGEQPCPLCVDNMQECIYDAVKTETPVQAVKRKHAQMQQDHDELRSLFKIIATSNVQKSLEIHNRIRAGQSPEIILQQLKHGDLLIQTKINSPKHVRHVLLSSLMQTNASFDDMVEFIGLTVAQTPGVPAPTAALLRQLRGQQTDLRGLRKLLGHTQPPLPQRRIAISDLLSDQGSQPFATAYPISTKPEPDNHIETPRDPIYKVPAKPWTRLTDDDDLVSHLISLYLEWVNPFFRVLEEDLFIKAMQSGDFNSEYCSPFLVNAMLGYACLYSEREGAFYQPDDYITRGQHFHDEAFRLWHLEEGTASLRNLQGLAVMYPGCIMRGKDKLGVALCAVLTQLNLSVPYTPQRSPSGSELTPAEIKAFQRARKSVAWSAFACDMATANTLLQPAWHTVCKDDLPTLDELPEESTHVWTGYPHRNKDDRLDKSVMWIHHCQLIQMTWRAQRLLYASDRNDPQFLNHVEALTEEMSHWKDNLPKELHFREDLPAPVYDLYSCYTCVIIALYSLFQPLGSAQSPQTERSSPFEQEIECQHPTPPHHIPETIHSSAQTLSAQTMRQRAIATAQDMAVMIGNFRHHYGLKITLPYFVNANGVVCFTLLQDLDNPASAAAFKEAFRCLLGAGMQLLWARGMARMLHLTAQNTGIKLPKAIEACLDAVADTAWTKADTEMLSSCWPNLVIVKDAKLGESVTMEDLIKKWEKLAVDVEEAKGGGMQAKEEEVAIEAMRPKWYIPR